MTPEYVLDMARQAMQVTMMAGAPMLLVSLVVGLFATVFRAATQLDEQTLSSIPKLLAVAVTMMLIGSRIVAVIVDYTHEVLINIPNHVNWRQPADAAAQFTMIQFTTTQLNGWIAMYWWPLVRVLAFIVIAPPFANTEIPTSIKVAFGVIITVALASMLPVPVGVSVGSCEGLWITLVQALIGLVLNFCVQLVFSTISGASEVVSIQMGLGFAPLLDPMQAESSMLLDRFLSLTAVAVFITDDGHLVFLHALFDSFAALPVSAAPLGNPGWQVLAGGGTIVFALALRIALPITAIMMIVNLGFAVLSYTAQALNPFAVDIAATLVVGLMLIVVMMTSLTSVVERSVMDALDLGGRAFSQFSILPR